MSEITMPRNKIVQSLLDGQLDAGGCIAALERALAAERERADRNQEDAERYRWLRDTDTAVVAWIEEDGPRWSIEGRDGHKITRDKLDAAIDAARRK